MQWSNDLNNMQRICLESKKTGRPTEVLFENFKEEHFPFPIKDLIHYNFQKHIVDGGFPAVKNYMREKFCNPGKIYYVSFVGYPNKT